MFTVPGSPGDGITSVYCAGRGRRPSSTQIPYISILDSLRRGCERQVRDTAVVRVLLWRSRVFLNRGYVLTMVIPANAFKYLVINSSAVLDLGPGWTVGGGGHQEEEDSFVTGGNL